MARWYFNSQGRAQGPFDESVLIKKIEAGELTLSDLVFCEGDDRWRAAGFFSQFQAASENKNVSQPSIPEPDPSFRDETVIDSFSEPPRFDSPNREPKVSGGPFRFDPKIPASWVLLQKISDGIDERFMQSGPFSISQIEAMLTQNKCQDTDYVWRPGYKRWVRIDHVPELDRGQSSGRAAAFAPDLIPFPDVSVDPYEGPTHSASAEILRAQPLSEVTAPAIRSETAKWSPEPPPPDADLIDDSERTVVTSVTAAHNSVPDFGNSNQTVVQNHDDDFDQKTVVYGGAGSSQFAANLPTRPAVPNSSIPQSPTGQPNHQTPAFDPEATFVASPTMLANLGHLSPQSASAPSSEPEAHPHHEDEIDGEFQPQQPSYLEGSEFDPEMAIEGSSVPFWHRYRRPLGFVFAGLFIGFIYVQFSSGPEDSPTPNETASTNNTSPAVEGASPDEKTSVQAEVPAETPAETKVETTLAQPEPTATPQSVSEPAAQPTEETASVVAPNPIPADTQPTPTQPGQQSVAQPTAPTPAPTPQATPPAFAQVEEAPPQAPNLVPYPPGPRTSILEIVPVQTDQSKVIFALNTDAPVGTKVYIALSGRSGDVLSFPSFQIVGSVERTANEIPSFDFSGRVPQGQYRVLAAIGDIRRSATVFIGKKNSDFEARMERHLKTISYQQQAEKKLLFYSSRRFEGMARNLGENYFKNRRDARKWRSFYSQWQKDLRSARARLGAQIEVDRRNQTAYPDELLTLRSAIARLIEQGDALNDAVLSNSQVREIASGGSLSIVKDFARIRSQAAELSSRR